MTNNILALLIIVAAFVGSSTRNRNVIIGMLCVIGAVLAYVSFAAAQVSDFGPLMGVGAFVGTFLLIYAFRKRG